MKRIQAIKVGLGVGLMAVTLGALANQAVHSFATGSIYYKSTAGGATYVVNVPTGNSTADTTVLIELQQNVVQSLNTWAYAVGSGAFAATSNAGALWSLSATLSNGTVQSSYFDFNKQSWTSFSTSSGSISSGWYGGDTVSMAMPFVQGSTMGSGASTVACPATFNALISTNDVLSYSAGWTIAPTEWVSAAGFSNGFSSASTYWILTKSTASTLVSGASSDYMSSFTSVNNVASFTLPTFAYTKAWSSFAASAGNPAAAAGTDTTFAAASLTKISTTGPGSAGVVAYNKCVPYYTRFTALNSAGNVIGAGVGLNRLW